MYIFCHFWLYFEKQMNNSFCHCKSLTKQHNQLQKKKLSPKKKGPFLLAAFLCHAFNLFLPPICPQWQNLRMPAAQTHLYRSISIPFRMRYRVEFKLCLLPFSGLFKMCLGMLPLVAPFLGRDLGISVYKRYLFTHVIHVITCL